MAGTVVGEAKIKLSFDKSGVSSSMKEVSGTIEATGKSSGASFGNAWSVAAGSIISKAVTKIAGMISSSMDNAIKRVDTLNNSQKVFQALGYTADETSTSMNRLTEYLDGLPTSMTTAVNGVQSLSASFGSLEKGTDYFIAMNDAGLAFGATTAQVENAITQLGQLSLDGPLDAATWNSLRNSGFSPVFAAMAKEAGITVGQLKESFGAQGTKTVQDFLSQLVKMDKQGTSSMSSLADMAKANTNGIGTALENVQNRIGKAMAKIIDHIGADRISKAINDISSSFSGMADVIIGALDWLGNNQWVLDGILTTLGAIMALGIAMKVAKFFKAVAAFASANPVMLAITAVLAGLGWIITHLEDIKKVVGNVANFFGSVFKTVGSVVGAVATSIGNVFSGIFNGIKAGLQALGTFFSTIFNGIWNLISPIVTRISAAFTTLFNWIRSLLTQLYNFFSSIINLVVGVIRSLVGIVTTVFNTIFTVVNNVFRAIWNVVSSVVNSIRAVIQPLINFFSGVFNAVLNAARSAFNAVGNVARGAWNAITSVFGNLAGFFGSIFSNAWHAVLSVFSTGGQIFVGIVDGIFNTFRSVVNALIGGINSVIRIPFDAINGVLDGIRGVQIFDWHPFEWIGHIFVPQIPYLAQGGVATAAQMAVIGEAGREAVLPLDNNTGNWAGLLAQTLVDEMDAGEIAGTGITIERQEFIINNGFDAREAGRLFMQDIRRLA